MYGFTLDILPSTLETTLYSRHFTLDKNLHSLPSDAKAFSLTSFGT